ncbi:MAG TPA: Trm112 family protein [Acidimicrobiia bacterium]
MSLIDPTLAEILVCPVDKADLIQDVDAQRLQCTQCGRRYPVRNGIPIMLVDQAECGPDE